MSIANSLRHRFFRYNAGILFEGVIIIFISRFSTRLVVLLDGLQSFLNFMFDLQHCGQSLLELNWFLLLILYKFALIRRKNRWCFFNCIYFPHLAVFMYSSIMLAINSRTTVFLAVDVKSLHETWIGINLHIIRNLQLVFFYVG